ncbi:putative Glyoxylate reductase [Rhodovastum atsumiense]|nr:NAD(P)-dependent oxidoreductase [Rhodovastum atsumiense]CAH2600072.1 putative Glyoxylate reductase [Rhodovastum atsumiense]
MHKLVFCRALHPEAMALLEAREDVSVTVLTHEFRGPPLQKELAAHIRDAFGIMVGLERVHEDLLATAQRLRVISRFGVGFDAIDIPACSKRGVLVSVANGANDLSVAEHTLMLMLMLARRAVEYDNSVRAGTWMIQTGRRMHELAGKRVLVVGYGRIGTRVARLCAAFGMQVMVTDPAFPTPRIAADGYIPAPDLWAALPEADIVTLHAPLDCTTRGMVNADFLERMKATAWLINTARGGLVDEAALAGALAGGIIEAAGIDVLVREPPMADNPLLKLPNVVLSPHNAAAPLECYAKMSHRAVMNLLDFIDGRLDPGYTVNPEVLGHPEGVG